MLFEDWEKDTLLRHGEGAGTDVLGLTLAFSNSGAIAYTIGGLVMNRCHKNVIAWRCDTKHLDLQTLGEDISYTPLQGAQASGVPMIESYIYAIIAAAEPSKIR